MADVTLVLDNADGLLPVDFQVLELGRRLYRSGENEYLLNKQRIRLRDLVDLLDAAHLADNAFLFIGQGMVDQALALRPEERRPLFEEVAGVRRHERRRRKAEEQLAESEANLARVDDILAELRPQARRLAAQAEQQTTRSSIADELAAALLASTHARWHEAAARLAAATRAADRRRGRDGPGDGRPRGGRGGAAGPGRRAVGAADVERERREAHETARAALTGLQLRDGRLGVGARGDRARPDTPADERAAAEAELTIQRRAMAAPVPARDLDLEAAVTEAERELADALAELATLRSPSPARGEELAALRRAEAAREAEAETARRRLAEAERQAAEERSAAEAAAARRDEATARSETARRALESATRGRAIGTGGSRDRPRGRWRPPRRNGPLPPNGSPSASSAAAALRGRLEALARSSTRTSGGRSPERRGSSGGRRLDEDLAVDPDLRAAVEAALADRARAYLVASRGVDGPGGRARPARRRGATRAGGGRARMPPLGAGSTASQRPAAADSPTPSGATRRVACVGCSIAPSGCPTSRAASTSRPPCRPAGSRSPATGRRSSTTPASRSARLMPPSSVAPSTRGWRPTSSGSRRSSPSSARWRT